VENIRKLLDAKHIADLVGIPVSSIYDLARRNVIPHIRIGKAVRFQPEKITEWLASGGSRGEK
jgi:excisionase family DNA binding protein